MAWNYPFDKGIRKVENRWKTMIFPFLSLFHPEMGKIGHLDQFSDQGPSALSELFSPTLQAVRGISGLILTGSFFWFFDAAQPYTYPLFCALDANYLVQNLCYFLKTGVLPYFVAKKSRAFLAENFVKTVTISYKSDPVRPASPIPRHQKNEPQKSSLMDTLIMRCRYPTPRTKNRDACIALDMKQKNGENSSKRKKQENLDEATAMKSPWSGSHITKPWKHQEASRWWWSLLCRV